VEGLGRAQRDVWLITPPDLWNDTMPYGITNVQQDGGPSALKNGTVSSFICFDGLNS